MKKFFVFVLCVFLIQIGLAVSSMALVPEWRSEGTMVSTANGPSNVTNWMDMVHVKEVPHVVLIDNNELIVKYFVVASREWKTLGSSLNSTGATTIYTPRIAVINDAPVVIFSEYVSDGVSGIYVKYWNGTNWTTLGTLNDEGYSGSYPFNITAAGNNVYIAFTQAKTGSEGQLYVKKWDIKKSTSWQTLGSGSLNCDSTHKIHDAGIEIGSNGSVFVAFTEINESGIYQLYVKFYAAGSWFLTGTSSGLNMSAAESAYYPCLAAARHGTMPPKLYVCWKEGNFSCGESVAVIYCKSYNFVLNTWENVGAGGIVDGGAYGSGTYDLPNMDLNSNAIPYVVLWQYNSNVHVNYFDSGLDTWKMLGSKLVSTSNIVGGTAISFSEKNALRAAWIEYNPLGYVYEKLWYTEE